MNLAVEKGDRVAIIGPNGAGKSTLLRMIMGTEKPNQGSVRLGDHNIFPNYFQQNQVRRREGGERFLGRGGAMKELRVLILSEYWGGGGVPG